MADRLLEAAMAVYYSGHKNSAGQYGNQYDILEFTGQSVLHECPFGVNHSFGYYNNHHDMTITAKCDKCKGSVTFPESVLTYSMYNRPENLIIKNSPYWKDNLERIEWLGLVEQKTTHFI